MGILPRVWGLGFWVWLSVLGLGFRDFVQGFVFRVLGFRLGFWVECLGILPRVWGLGFWVWLSVLGLGFRDFV